LQERLVFFNSQSNLPRTQDVETIEGARTQANEGMYATMQDGSRRKDLIDLYYSNNNLQSTGGIGAKGTRKRKHSAGYLAAT
jgi:hypothetical protein